jgi:hypothetical protein
MPSVLVPPQGGVSFVDRVVLWLRACADIQMDLAAAIILWIDIVTLEDDEIPAVGLDSRIVGDVATRFHQMRQNKLREFNIAKGNRDFYAWKKTYFFGLLYFFTRNNRLELRGLLDFAYGKFSDNLVLKDAFTLILKVVNECRENVEHEIIFQKSKSSVRIAKVEIWSGDDDDEIEKKNCIQLFETSDRIRVSRNNLWIVPCDCSNFKRRELKTLSRTRDEFGIVLPAPSFPDRSLSTSPHESAKKTLKLGPKRELSRISPRLSWNPDEPISPRLSWNPEQRKRRASLETIPANAEFESQQQQPDIHNHHDSAAAFEESDNPLDDIIVINGTVEEPEVLHMWNFGDLCWKIYK